MEPESELNLRFIASSVEDLLDLAISLNCKCLKVLGIEVKSIEDAPPEPTVTVCIDS